MSKKVFTDNPRESINELFYDYQDNKKINTMTTNIYYVKYLISLDKHFFDSYVELSNIYLFMDEAEKSHRILSLGYKRLMREVFSNDHYPKELEYLIVQNRHIYRLLFSYAQSLWLYDLKEVAKEIFIKLLELDQRDALGSRYMIVGILEGYKNSYELSEPPEDINLWFLESSKKHLNKYKILKGYNL